MDPTISRSYLLSLHSAYDDGINATFICLAYAFNENQLGPAGIKEKHSDKSGLCTKLGPKKEC